MRTFEVKLDRGNKIKSSTKCGTCNKTVSGIKIYVVLENLTIHF